MDMSIWLDFVQAQIGLAGMVKRLDRTAVFFSPRCIVKAVGTTQRNDKLIIGQGFTVLKMDHFILQIHRGDLSVFANKTLLIWTMHPQIKIRYRTCREGIVLCFQALKGHSIH
ncbi:hypothetical protein D3C78_1670660 [compost metagenome]